MTLVLRSAKGSRLTHNEMDGNWQHAVDSANSSFVQSGIGAIATTVEADLRARAINAVTQFGVATSNTGAVNVTRLTAALDAGSTAGKAVYIPGAAANYPFDAEVAVPVETYLFGDGKIKTVLEFTGAVNGLVASFGSQTSTHLVLKDFGLTGSSSGLNLLKLNNASRVTLDGLRFRLAGLSSVISDGTCIGINVKDVEFSEASTAFWHVNSGLTSLIKFENCQYDTDTTPPLTVLSTSGAILVASGASLTNPTFINTNQNGGQADGMGSFCRVEGAMSFAKFLNAYVEQTRNAAILAVGSGVVNLMEIIGGSMHCITSGNTAAVDLNNGEAHLSPRIIGLRSTVGSAVAVFDPGSSTDWTYLAGSRETGTQHVIGAVAGANNVSNTTDYLDGQILLNDGVTGAGATIPLAFQNDPDTGLFRPAANAIAISAGGTERARISVDGYLKASPSGSYRGATDDYHEISSALANFNVLIVRHTHATTPNALFLEFSGGAPNNNTQAFITALDNTATRAQLFSSGALKLAVGTAVPAGGTAGIGLMFSTTANLGVFFGSGVPTLSAAQGSLYIRTDGSSTSTRMYVNTDGGTTWTNVVTAL